MRPRWHMARATCEQPIKNAGTLVWFFFIISESRVPHWSAGVGWHVKILAPVAASIACMYRARMLSRSRVPHGRASIAAMISLRRISVGLARMTSSHSSTKVRSPRSSSVVSHKRRRRRCSSRAFWRMLLWDSAVTPDHVCYCGECSAAGWSVPAGKCLAARAATSPQVWSWPLSGGFPAPKTAHACSRTIGPTAPRSDVQHESSA